jgi:hypothetical protein
MKNFIFLLFALLSFTISCTKDNLISPVLENQSLTETSSDIGASDRTGPCPTNAFLDTWGNNPLNKEELLESGLDCWRAFEISACNAVATSSTTKKGAQVSIDVTFTRPTGGPITLTIIADYIEQSGTSPNIRYQIIDAKCSNVTELSTKPSLLTTCTANQRQVYQAINNTGGYNMTNAVVVGTMGAAATTSNLDRPNGTSGLVAGTNITSNLIRNVQFLVNTPKTSCNQVSNRRNLVL